MSIYEFAKNLFENAVDTLTTYSIEDAAEDIKNAITCEWEIPDGMDAESLCSVMNDIIAEMAE